MRRNTLIALTLLSVFLAVMVAQKINLTTADLGRHIKNGEVMLHAEKGRALNSDSQGPSLRNQLLHTNFYSYTESNFPFVNHHWGTGIVFYLIFSVFGWAGLSLFNILLFVGTFALLFLLANRRLSLLYLVPLSIFLLPLISDRTEIRPETISYLFIAVFIYLLVRFTEKNLDKKFLYALPVITLLWANLHIYFVFGLFILGTFILEKVIHRDWVEVKFLLGILGLSVVASAITPFGPKALLYPFTIFQNYGYKLVENQSISFLENISFFNPNFIWWKITAVLTGVTTILTLWKKPKNYPIALGIIAVTFGVLSFLSIRNFSIFGLVLLPYLAYLLGTLGSYWEKASRRAWLERSAPSADGDSVVFPKISEQTHDLLITGSIITSLLLIIIIPIRYPSNMPWSPSWGVGLMPNVNASAEFVQSHNIEGPIFSNYDIGGYLIYNLFPTQKIFVDNRPEAYSVEFFQNTYVPMQENPEVWREKLQEYNFNTIWFYRHDYTPWAQEFLIAKVQDPEWAPVYVDNYVIIFVRRVTKNVNLIEDYELPKNLFSTK